MFPDLASARELSSVLEVLSAMITPAVLILASGSLIMTTSSRSMRCVDRVRERANELEALGTDGGELIDRKRDHLYRQLEINTRRARMLQRAMATLYIGIAFFIGTSIAIGVVSLLGIHTGWIPLVLGFIGSGLLLGASILLIYESQLSVATTSEEMDYIHRNYVPGRLG